MVQIFKAPKGRKPKKTLGSRLIGIKIDFLDHEGTGISRSHQPVLFVEGALPGEVCDVLVSQKKNTFWRGQAVKITHGSEDRQPGFCEYFSTCGGCQNQHIKADALLAHKQQAIDGLLRRIGGVDDITWCAPLSATEQGYRRKARLAVDAQDPNDVRVGFRDRNNRIINIHQCPVLTSVLNSMLEGLQALLQSLKTVKAVGHISLVDALPAPLLVFRLTRPLPEQDNRRLLAYAQQQQVRLVLEITKNQFEAQDGAECESYYGLDDGSQLHFMPNDFIQVNGRINQEMILQAIEWLAPDKQDSVLDLFCGIGNFSVPLARYCDGVTGIEGVTEMVERARENARRNQLSNVFYEHRDLNQTDSLKKLSGGKWNKILLDPARAGAFEVVKQIPALSPEKVLYVSCNPATFARDTQAMLDGGYQLDKICLMDMFPGTSHTELMALFRPV